MLPAKATSPGPSPSGLRSPLVRRLPPRLQGLSAGPGQCIPELPSGDGSPSSVPWGNRIGGGTKLMEHEAGLVTNGRSLGAGGALAQRVRQCVYGELALLK